MAIRAHHDQIGFQIGSAGQHRVDNVVVARLDAHFGQDLMPDKPLTQLITARLQYLVAIDAFLFPSDQLDVFGQAQQRQRIRQGVRRRAAVVSRHHDVGADGVEASCVGKNQCRSCAVENDVQAALPERGDPGM